MAIGMGDLIILILIAAAGLSLIAGMVYATVLVVRRIFSKVK